MRGDLLIRSFATPPDAWLAYKKAKESNVRSYITNEYGEFLSDKVKNALLTWEADIDD